jgi:hypothetical protein
MVLVVVGKELVKIQHSTHTQDEDFSFFFDLFKSKV